MIKVVELKDLTLGYNKVLFSGINATAHEGELIAIIGPNGMGKSTLLKSISSIIGVMGGEISLFAKSVDSYSHKEIASVLSLVPSNSPRTGNLSLFDMISAGTYNRTGWMGNLDDRPVPHGFQAAPVPDGEEGQQPMGRTNRPGLGDHLRADTGRIPQRNGKGRGGAGGQAVRQGRHLSGNR